jgi:DNA polymerase-3 subunit chi
MTRIDFYVLPTSDAQNRRLLACRLAEKAYRQGMKIYLHTASEEEDRIMDDLLWTFRQGSFVPHERETVPEAQRQDVAVVIGHTAPPDDIRDLFINLSQETPRSFERFERMAELVDQDESLRQQGRRRYRIYQEQGHPLATHRLDAVG